MTLTSFYLRVSIIKLLAVLVTASLWLGLAQAQTPTWTNTTLLPEQRASLLLAQMTLEEKIAMVHGVPGSYVGNVTNNARLGIPALHLQDGPAGIANSGIMNVTALPAPIALGATWDVSLARKYGEVLGAEARGKGVHVLLAPMIHTTRVPQGGRNFETFGEDPFLNSAISASDVMGIQSQRVIANAKTFICNDQENDRGLVSAEVDDRALHEIYYPPFLACVRSGLGSVMTSYNRVNGEWASQAPELGTVLKARWGFGGFTVCDWGAAFSAFGGANNGLDMEMAEGQKFGDSLCQEIQLGNVTVSQLDEMVHRIFTSMFRFGIFDDPTTNTILSSVTNVAHTALARDVSAQSMVLLKNATNGLPLNSTNLQALGVFGTPAFENPIWGGTGSAWVYLSYYDVPLDAISNRAGTNVLINYHQGDSGSITQAVQLAKQSDAAIICVGQQTGEGEDRSSLSLPGDQDQLISAVAAVNPRTIVVLYESSGTLMPWINDVAAVVVAWYPGQEGGRALASVLFGDVNPSGKLPLTFPVSSNQVPASTLAQYPGIDHRVSYSESLRVGYRWYDASNQAPLFPFGHGLSYTTFAYSNLTVSAVSPSGQVTVSVDVNNTGTRAGAEVAQLYLGFPAAAGEPPKQLKGFHKVSLQPGQTQRIDFNLVWENLAFWNVAAQEWTVPLGNFQIYVGASSRDIRLTGTFTVSSPVPSNGMANQALFKLTTASLIADTNHPALKATDGDPETFWIPPTNGPNWITADLGCARQIVRARLQWQTNEVRGYQIRFSNDNTNWTAVYSTNTASGSIDDRLVSGIARYVQIYVTSSATASGAALRELELYSPELQLKPKLTVISTKTNAVVLSWPSSWGGSFLKQNQYLNLGKFVLEQNSSLGSTDWTLVEEPSLAIGTNQVMVLPAGGREFYRLRNPSWE